MSVPDHFWFCRLVCEKIEVLRLAVVTLSSVVLSAFIFATSFRLRTSDSKSFQFSVGEPPNF